MENLYEILNCAQDASTQTLKKSYQELALKYHPDKSKNGDQSTERFVKINYAWKILSEPWLREQYDIKWKERCLAQSFPIQDTVDIDEFDVIESVKHKDKETNTPCSSIDDTGDTNVKDNCYIYPCRCGGSYMLTSVDYKLNFDIVCCDTCSLSVQVIYNNDENS